MTVTKQGTYDVSLYACSIILYVSYTIFNFSPFLKRGNRSYNEIGGSTLFLYLSIIGIYIFPFQLNIIPPLLKIVDNLVIHI